MKHAGGWRQQRRRAVDSGDVDSKEELIYSVRENVRDRGDIEKEKA